MSLDTENNYKYFDLLKEQGVVSISSNSNCISNAFREWLEYIEYPFLLKTERTSTGIIISTFVKRR